MFQPLIFQGCKFFGAKKPTPNPRLSQDVNWKSFFEHCRAAVPRFFEETNTVVLLTLVFPRMFASSS